MCPHFLSITRLKNFSMPYGCSKHYKSVHVWEKKQPGDASDLDQDQTQIHQAVKQDDGPLSFPSFTLHPSLLRILLSSSCGLWQVWRAVSTAAIQEVSRSILDQSLCPWIRVPTTAFLPKGTGREEHWAGNSVLFSWASIWQKEIQNTQLRDQLAQSMGPPAQMLKYKVQHRFIIHSINVQQNSFQRTNEE